jgi:GT2 family glycosyltransferase
VDLTVVIVNWNGVDLLDACLQSVADHVPARLTYELVVVDNGSEDGSLAHLRARWPRVRVIANEENVGFCRANNQAIRASESTHLLLLNTDARLTAGSVEAMLGYLDRDDRAAVVGPRLVYGDGTFQRWTAGRPLSLRTCAAYLLGLDRLSALVPACAGMYLATDTDEAFLAGWVSSAVMLVRRAALDDIGLLDESIFVYMDDVDLCQRAVDAGWHVWYAADATAVHFMGATAKRETGRASPEALRALNRWFARRHGRRAARLLQVLETVGFGARAALCALYAVVRRDQSTRRRAQAHWALTKLSLEAVGA